MDKLVDKRIVLVSGCDRGIGLTICKRFAMQGAIVYANILKEESVSALHDGDGLFADRIIPICFDITDKNAVFDCVKKIKNDYGYLDILVNNAGFKKDGLVGMVDDNSINKMFDVNVFGMINLTQCALRLLKKSQGASIVNVCSIVGLRGNAGQSVYGATKGAVASMTKSWAKEFAASNIRCNAVAPGSIDTEMFYEGMSELKIKETINAIELRRLGKPEEVADVILFLASDMASYVTGEIINVTGGLFI